MPFWLKKPAAHAVRLQLPPVHVAPVVWAGTPHPLPQRPQFDVLVVRFTSQPFAERLSQLPKFAAQPVIAQLPLAHAALAFDRLQTLGHAPQWLGSALRLTHAPLQLVSPA